MNQLRNSIANKDEVKASQPYVDADTDKQMHTTQLLQVLKISLMQRVSRHLIHLQ